MIFNQLLGIFPYEEYGHLYLEAVRYIDIDFFFERISTTDKEHFFHWKASNFRGIVQLLLENGCAPPPPVLADATYDYMQMFLESGFDINGTITRDGMTGTLFQYLCHLGIWPQRATYFQTSKYGM